MEPKALLLSSPHANGNEAIYVSDALQSNWLAPLGPHIDHFEKELSRYVGTNYAAALSSGTAAIHLALIILKVSKNDLVFCQSSTFAASANPIVYQGATPVFLDSEPNGWNLDPEVLEHAIKHYAVRGKRPKAVIGVHLYGMPIQLDEVMSICSKYEIPFIEDAAEALGSSYKGKKVGSFGEMSILSFNGNKIITATMGGALLSNQEAYHTKACFLATQARDPAPHYEHSSIGYNYRLSNVCAAIGRAQLETLDEKVASRRSNFEHYRQNLASAPGIAFQNEAEHSLSNRWLTAMLLDPQKTKGVTSGQIRIALTSNAIESRPVWKPMHLQPVFNGAPYFGGEVSESLFRNGICLPSGSNLTKEDLTRVTTTLSALLG